jgi:hypothetical protein
MLLIHDSPVGEGAMRVIRNSNRNSATASGASALRCRAHCWRNSGPNVPALSGNAP